MLEQEKLNGLETALAAEAERYKQLLREKERFSRALVLKQKQALDEADIYLQELARREEIRKSIRCKAKKEKQARENYCQVQAELYKLRLQGYMRPGQQEEDSS